MKTTKYRKGPGTRHPYNRNKLNMEVTKSQQAGMYHVSRSTAAVYTILRSICAYVKQNNVLYHRYTLEFVSRTYTAVL